MVYDQCLACSYSDISTFAREMKEKGIKPEMELYHPGMYRVVQNLIMRGLIEPLYDIQFVTGFQTSSFPTPANLLSLVNQLPPQSIFCTIGVGCYQLPMNTLSTMLGGHVRAGLENNVCYSRGRDD
jgi:3-keto-5-aminohexanoate cleavage enzyme